MIFYDNNLGADDTGNEATELGGENIMNHKKKQASVNYILGIGGSTPGPPFALLVSIKVC